VSEERKEYERPVPPAAPTPQSQMREELGVRHDSKTPKPPDKPTPETMSKRLRENG